MVTMEHRAVEASEQLLCQLSDRIVAQFQPERVVLLGGAVTGMGAWSEVELLIVLPGDWDYRERAVAISESAQVPGIAFDPFLTTPQRFAHFQTHGYYPPHFNLSESRVLYERR